MQVFIVTRHHYRPLRVHHFAAGALLAALGAAMMLHDRDDWREALRCQ